MMNFDKQDAHRLDIAAYHHGDPLDGQHCEPELPKDAPEDLCLDHLCNARAQMAEHIEKLARGAAPMPAVMSYLQGVIRECVKAGVAEWMEQENDPSTFKGDEAVIKLLDVVMGTMLGDGGMVRISARQVKFRAEVILFILQKTPKTLTQIAAEHGYTKANASAIAKQYQRKYDLRKSRGMKSDAAVEVYRERAKRVHKERKQQQTICKTKSKFNSYWS
jgi:hypothetical protein